MLVTESITSQYIHAEMTQLYVDLERILQEVLEQSGDRIKPDQQEEVKKDVEGTKYLLDCFKRKYITE
jgi:hypothetical protein